MKILTLLLVTLLTSLATATEDSITGRIQDKSSESPSASLNSHITPVFMQLSDNDSGNSNFVDESMILTVFLLNIIGCALGCLFIQGVIIVSKRLTLELANLRRNYDQFKSLKKFKELRESSINI